ncbi:phosphatidylinositol/phosphatidylcholine transfer protein SFH11 isoform X2 [Cannabis sativa]|uniref:phosphatidylinositol/phosphatidylcholine transfer protein SFH11 isoform X2 n=1 Tax=Cannabis sativa TaxID=3483 RepID=UPI0029C9F217|nr:phosphatidylinositol/phosphatidylcholine transfer protein SFH11 isoform X2 [Cannabis sativa]
MYKSKDKDSTIVITRSSGNGGGNGSRETSSSNWQTSREKSTKRTKTIHPPIECHWQLPPIKEDKKSSLSSSSSSSSSFKSMLSYPLKLGGAMKKIGRTKSMQQVLEGNHDPKDEHLVQSFREMLFLEVQLPPKHNDYHTLLRFLRMRDFNFAEAKEMFLNYLKWREEYRVDAIHKEFKFEEHERVKKCYPHGFHGVDRNGRPIYIERIGMIDVNQLLQVTTVERFVRYHVSEQEKTLKLRYPSCSIAAKTHVASTTTILDVQGGLANFSKPARYIFMEIQKIDSCYYPETMHRLFIVNAGSGFRMLWKVVKAFLDARTLAKIKVLGYNYLNELLEVIDLSCLPTFLGGNCTCDDYGGCLLSDKGPWNDPDIAEIVQAITTTTDEENNNGEEDHIETTAPQSALARNMKIRGLETALADTKKKIEALEDLLDQTKIALKGLTLHIEDLKSF